MVKTEMSPVSQQQEGRSPWGIPVEEQKLTNPDLYHRVVQFMGPDAARYTPGQIASSVDVFDWRSRIGDRTIGHFTSMGSSGPKKK